MIFLESPAAAPSVATSRKSCFVGSKIGLSPGQLMRYDACDDLVQQLVPYARRKRAENPSQSLFDMLFKIDTDVTRKVSSGQWDISSAEITRIMKRVRELLAENLQNTNTPECPRL